MSGKIVAILGAESTGKTTLVRGLAQALGGAYVDEYLRAWCDREGRTPLAHEQRQIAAEQARRIEAAAAEHALVICDTTPLMTAVYSDFVFRDDSLYDAAAAWHQRCHATLVTALDLPWVADGVQRTSPAVQAPVDALLVQALADSDIAWSRVAGNGSARLASALEALRRSGIENGGTGPA